MINKLPALYCEKWVISPRCAAEKAQSVSGRKKPLPSYWTNGCALDLHPSSCCKASAVGLAVTPTALRDGPGQILADIWKETPALLGAGTGSHPSPGWAASLQKKRPFGDCWRTSGNSGEKKALSPNKVWAKSPISWGCSLQRACGDLLWQLCPEAPVPALLHGFSWDKPGLCAPGTWLNAWPGLASRDLFVTGLGILHLWNHPCSMPPLQRKGGKEKRLGTMNQPWWETTAQWQVLVKFSKIWAKII